MKRSKKSYFFIIPGIICLLFITYLLLTPKLCMLRASAYINKKYPEYDFKYTLTEYSKAHAEYFIHFQDSSGRHIALMASPFEVIYDPLCPRF